MSHRVQGGFGGVEPPQVLLLQRDGQLKLTSARGIFGRVWSWSKRRAEDNTFIKLFKTNVFLKSPLT